MKINPKEINKGNIKKIIKSAKLREIKGITHNQNYQSLILDLEWLINPKQK